MIEARLSLPEARWMLQLMNLGPSPDSPLRDPLALVAEVPGGSSVESELAGALTARGLLLPGRRVNPFAAAALRWLAQPEVVWSLALFGRGGAEAIHLAFREGAAVECRRGPSGLRLRFPLPANEAREWLALQVEGGRRGA
jgi:hypothetical protein